MNRSEPIIAKAHFSKPIQEVWSAITDHERMIKWYFENIPEFRPEMGFRTEFLIENEGRQFTHTWEIVQLNPPKSITYTWCFKEYPGLGHVTFELQESEGGTALTLTNTGLDSFPQDIPEFTRESCQGGWDYFIGQRLVEYLGKD